MSYGSVHIEETPEKLGRTIALGIVGLIWWSVLLVLVNAFSNHSIEAQQTSTGS